MTRCGGNLGSSKGIKVSGSAAACVLRVLSEQSLSVHVAGTHVHCSKSAPLEEGRDFVVERE